MQLDAQKIAIAVLSVLLVLALGYIGWEKYNQQKESDQLSAFQQGAQYGYQQAVIQMMQQASSCNRVALTNGNQTMEVVAVQCLTGAANAS